MSEKHARGALLGLAVGDALGTTHEFKALSAPPFPRLATGPLVDIVGGGPFHVARGQITDDTQMACCLAASLLRAGELDVDDVARRYVSWVETGFDAGSLTRAALGAIASGTPAQAAGRDAWLASARQTAGNGSLMRTTPIAIFFARRDEARRRAALAGSAITHFDPRCRLACASLVARCRRGRAVAVHCMGGLGRSGLVAACVLVAQDRAPADAIAAVRAARSGAIETRAQEAFVARYAAWRAAHRQPPAANPLPGPNREVDR